MELKFNFEPVHNKENNPLSEEHLNAHRLKFSHDCLEVFTKLADGERLTVKGAMISGLTASLPRRILDLREEGYQISDAWIESGRSKIKEYFMTAEDRAKSLQVLLSKKIAA